MEPISLIDFAKKVAKESGEHTEQNILATAFINSHYALSEIKKYNHINNDLDAYLFDLAEWAVGESEHKQMPKPEDYGIIRDMT